MFLTPGSRNNRRRIASGVVSGTGASPDLAFWTGSNTLSGDGGLTYTGNGLHLNLGDAVSNANPVNINTVPAAAQFTTNGNNFWNLGLVGVGNNGSAAAMFAAKTRGATANVQTTINNGDQIFAFWGKGSNGNVYSQAGVISLNCNALPTQLPDTQGCPSFWEIDTCGVTGALGAIYIDNTSVIGFGTAQQGIGNHPSVSSGGPSTVTITIASPAVVTLNAHGFVPGQQISFATTGTLPTGITAGAFYYVIGAGLTANTFQFSRTPVPGNPVNTSGSQSGTQTITNTTTSYFLPITSWGSPGLSGSGSNLGQKVQQYWNTTGVIDATLLVSAVNIAAGTGSLIFDAQVTNSAATNASVFNVGGTGLCLTTLGNPNVAGVTTGIVNTAVWQQAHDNYGGI